MPPRKTNGGCRATTQVGIDHREAKVQQNGHQAQSALRGLRGNGQVEQGRGVRPVQGNREEARPAQQTLIAIDTETTGLDFWHGARPYFVTTCDQEGKQTWWEWDVDPLTREVNAPKEDRFDVGTALMSPSLVGHNIKFDVHALWSIAESPDCWPWDRTHDTIIAAHLLASNQPKNLTDLAVQWLGKDIEPLEKRLERVVQACRRHVQQARLRGKRAKAKPRWDVRGRRIEPPRDPLEFLGEWAIAGEGRPDMPSVKEKSWKQDSWLPRAMLKAGCLPETVSEEEAETVLADYANADSATTVQLWLAMEAELHRRGLWAIYQERIKLVRIAWMMEQSGVTVNRQEQDNLKIDYQGDSALLGEQCLEIAAGFGYDLDLPNGGNNKSLRTFCFDHLRLPPLKRSEKTGEPSLDKEVLETYEATLEPDSPQHQFVKALRAKRSRDTAVSYLESYERFWLPLYDTAEKRIAALFKPREVGQFVNWYVLHPNLNITGTDTLRWSSNNPNEQNISKKEGFNLRRCFGPAPGREWWSLDYQNLELRIPAYEAGEKDLIEVFERPNDPPYYGSYHLVVFDLLHPKLFAEHGKECKTLFESTWYQWVKNGNFAVIYGCQEVKADQTYHVPGAYQKIQKRFPKIAALAAKQISLANKLGRVETIPDRSVDPQRGYPIMCGRSEWGRISPTVPLNYHIQSTAMWITARAMVKCQEQFDRWKDFSGRMVLQVHDELVFDLPKGRMDPLVEKGKNIKFRLGSNLWRINVLKKLMESCGPDLGVPTPVAVEYHARSWDEGVRV